MSTPALRQASNANPRASTRSTPPTRPRTSDGSTEHKEKDENGGLPLHRAVEKHASEAGVAALLQAYPEAASEKDKAGMLPLRIAVEKGASEAVVALLQAYPEAAKEKDENGMLPLHWALYETGYIKATEVEGESKEAGAKVSYKGREMVVSQVRTG